jgi:transcriptional regulator with XRE-family HTH domain
MMTSQTRWIFDKERLVALREARGATQEEFAKELGITKQQLSVWERGKFWPGRKRWLNICATFGVRPEYFLRQTTYHDDIGGRNKRCVKDEVPA